MSGKGDEKENGLDEERNSEFTPPPQDDNALDSVERDFNREQTKEQIKKTLWQNKRVRISLISMGGLAMMAYVAWVILS